jgi:hypothetical protein
MAFVAAPFLEFPGAGNFQPFSSTSVSFELRHSILRNKSFFSCIFLQHLQKNRKNIIADILKSVN